MHTDEVPACAVEGSAGIQLRRIPGWLVIRAYRGRKLVISMHETLAEAEGSFASEEERLRGGDVILARAALETFSVASGAAAAPDGNWVPWRNLTRAPIRHRFPGAALG